MLALEDLSNASARRAVTRASATLAAAALLAGAGLLAPTAAQAAPVEAKAATPRPQQVKVGTNPSDVAVAQGLGRAFVLDQSSITAVSLLTQRPLATFGSGSTARAGAIALMQSETEAYVTHPTASYVSVVDTETQKPLRQIEIGGSSVDVVKANTSDGQRAYVSLGSTKALAVVQTRTSKVLSRVHLPAEAEELAAQPGGRYVWAASAEDTRLFRVSTTTGKVKTYRVGDRVGPVEGLAFTANGKQLWVSGPGGIGRLDTRTGTVSKRLSADKIFTTPEAALTSIALGDSGRYLYAENGTEPQGSEQLSGAVASIDTRTMKVAYRVTTGQGPRGLAIDTRRDVAYAPNSGDGTVTWFAGAR